MDIQEEITASASCGDTKKLDLLIHDNPGMINDSDRNGLVPLAAALLGGHGEAVNLLLNRGAAKECGLPFGQTSLEWARKQEGSDAAAILLAWDYLDRLNEAAMLWRKHNIRQAYCDVCTAMITEEESTMLKIDEVFKSGEYTSRIAAQAVRSYPSELENKSEDEIIKAIKEQIDKSSSTGRYFVCGSCLEKYFSEIVFGKSRDSILGIVSSIFDERG